jgi:hypothetical protein
MPAKNALLGRMLIILVVLRRLMVFLQSYDRSRNRGQVRLNPRFVAGLVSE